MLLHVAIFFAVLCQTVAISASEGCGLNDPGIAASLQSVVQRTSAQRYELHHPSSRRLENTSTNDTSFVPLSIHGGSPIRIRIVWDVIDAGDPTTWGSHYQCSYVGQQINVLTADGGYTLSSDRFCEERHLVHGSRGAARGNAIRSRTAEAVEFYASSLRIRPVLDEVIWLDIAALASYFTLGLSSVSDADVVVIMTARPSPSSPISGHAKCMQLDQYGRCTVGWINWSVQRG